MKAYIYLTDTEPLRDEGLFWEAYSRIPSYRQQKTDHLKASEDKRRSLAAGLLLSYALVKAGIRPDSEIVISEYGKPFLRDESVCFNLSHSGNMAACILSRKNVGCDIEDMRRRKDISIAKRFFSKEEYAYILEGKDETEKERRFFNIWTLKESYIKLKGKGLGIPLDSFSFRIMCDKIYVCDEENPDVLSFGSVFTPGGYCLSFGIEDKNAGFDIRHVSVPEIGRIVYGA